MQMNRVIEVRYWDPEGGGMVYCDLSQVAFARDHWKGPMQFTGLHDKQGGKIYEGDIMECSPGGPRHLVSWSETRRRHVVGHGEAVEELSVGFFFDGYYGLPEQWGVIGNVFQTPELVPGHAGG